MHRIHENEEFSPAVEKTIEEIERRTDAEIIVVVGEQSDDYASARARVASAVTLLAAAALVFSPLHVREVFFLLDLVIVWFVVERIFRYPGLLKRITRGETRVERCVSAAKESFVEEAVHGTPNRSGILVYLSEFEEQVLLVPDLGVEGKVPKGELAAARAAFGLETVEGFTHGLLALGKALEVHVPHLPGSDDVDLPNTPRIRR